LAIASGYDTILAPATANAKNIMPRGRGAARCHGRYRDIIKVLSPDTFERLIYAGNAVQTVRSKGGKKVITVRTAAFQAAGEDGTAVSRAGVATPGSGDLGPSSAKKSPRPTGRNSTSARVVVSGGRAMASRENFAKYLEPVADKLGAAVGASRAAVDAGYAPNDWQSARPVRS